MSSQDLFAPDKLEPEEALRQAHKSITKSKLRMLTTDNAVFFSSLLANLKLIVDVSHPTAAVDGVHLWMNPNFCLQQSTAQLVGLLMHETMHCALEHMDRRKTADLDPATHNMAADHHINLLLTREKYELPDGAIMDRKYTGWSTRQIYDDLIKDPPPDKDDYDQDIVLGGGDDNADPDGTAAEEHAEQIKTNLIKAVMQADMAGDPGSVPDNIRRRVEELLNPKLPWENILQNHMSRHGREDYYWGRPNRRYLPDLYLPSIASDALKQITVGRDVSGSMTMQMLSEFMVEIQYIWDTMKPISLRVMDFDTQVQADKTYTLGDEFDALEITGGGGTDVGPCIEAIRADSPEIAIIFSDGEFWMPDLSNLYTDLIWIIIDNPSFTVPYGTVIHFGNGDDNT